MTKVFGIHMIELAPGVTEQELSEFVRGEGRATLSEGAEFHLLKADKGPQEGPPGGQVCDPLADRQRGDAQPDLWAAWRPGARVYRRPKGSDRQVWDPRHGLHLGRLRVGRRVVAPAVVGSFSADRS
jgi:hypothetical protein